MKNLSYLLLLILILASCASPQDENKNFVEIDGNKIPILNLGIVEEEPVTIGWSAIFEDVEIIPLETDKKCMIRNWRTGLSPNSLYLATQTGSMGPARLMEFDYNGKYLRDIGGGGNGPGEHTGHSLDDIKYYSEFDVIYAEFNGYPMENQLFTLEAEFIGEVNNSFVLGGGMGMIDENLFFTLGFSYGKPNYRRDSVLLEWHDKNGKPIKAINRTIYPAQNNMGFSPYGSDISKYRYENGWHIYSPGNDTIYKISGQEISPIAIVELGEMGVQLNETMDPKEVIGHFNIGVLAENENYWILKKSIYTKCDVEDFGSGQWGGEVGFDYSLIIIDKQSGIQRNIQFEDDLLGIIGWDMMDYYFQWDDSGRFYIILGALELIEKIDEALETDKIPESGKEKVKQLRESIDENSNPVLFMFKERKKYKLD